MSFRYLGYRHAVGIHDEIIHKSGGLLGIKHKGLLRSTLDHIQNDLYYPTITEKTVHLFYSINKNHCFQDGNKRASIALSAYFLEINEYDFCVLRFISEMENFAVEVAENRIDKNLVADIIESIIYELDYSEELKLKIIKALQKP